MGFSVGLLFAAASAVFNGSFGSLAKVKPVREAQVSPLVFNFWMCEGAALAGVLALAASPRVFTAWGLLSGALFVAACVNTFAAIHYLGLSVASGLWCGTAVLVSFGYGVAFAGDTLTDTTLAGVALALLVTGVAGIAAAGQLGQPPAGPLSEDSGQLYDALSVSAEGVEQLAGGELVRSQQWRRWAESCTRFPLGCTAAVAAGGFGGLVLAPMLQAPPDARGLPFLPSMAAGIFLASPLATFCLSALLARPSSDPLQSPDVVAWHGLAAGAVWQAGNVCSILAVQDPGVGLAIAYPIMQCGLFVAGAWGVLLFKEIRGRWQALYWASGAVLLTGAGLLSAAK